MHRLAPLVLAALLIAAAPASAQYEPEAKQLRAHAGWLSWERQNERLVARGETGAGQAFPYVIQQVDLGPDARGRTVGVYADCDETGPRISRWRCTVRERRLATGTERTLIREQRGVTAVSQHRGALAIGDWTKKRVLLRRRGAWRFTTVLRDQPGSRLELGDGFLAWFGESDWQERVGVIDLRGAKPKPRAVDATSEPCRCTRAVRVHDVALDGHHLHWLQEVLFKRDGGALGDGGDAEQIFRIRRIDVRDKTPVIEDYVPGGPITSIAVADGVVFHNGLGHDFRDGHRPEWKPAPAFP